MYKYLYTHGTRFALIIAMAISVLFLVSSAIFEKASVKELNNFNHINFGIICALILLLLSFVSSIYFWVKKMKNGFGKSTINSKVSILILGLFIGSFIVYRFFINDAVLDKMALNYGISQNISSAISAGIILTFLSLILSVILILYFEVKKGLK
jgi:hypothetical protein